MYFLVEELIGTKRCLFPFPVTFIKPSSKNKSEIFKEIN
jgi:hypothetical protein